jgi:hypothetical protein
VRLKWRRRRAPVADAGPELEIRLERARYAPGETVRGSVVPIEGGDPGELQVWLSFHERSTEYEAVRATIPGEILGPGGRAGGGHRFEIDLPRDARPSLASRHGELWWAVAAARRNPESGEVVTRRIEVQHPRATAESVAAEPLGGERRPEQRAW